MKILINQKVFCFINNFKTYVIVSASVLLLSGCAQRWEITDPYESVDWKAHGQYKANFHTHTTHSDGRMHPQTVVDKYHELGYDVLALTDHNAVTYPWTSFSEMTISNRSIRRMEEDPDEMPEDLEFKDRDPDVLGMIAIQANELSSHHHMGSFFTDHNGTTSEIESLEATAAKNGITMLYHPGRYRDPAEVERRSIERKKVEWYVDLYESYEHLIGMEVYNGGDRYPDDRKLWDSILTLTMPDRTVWGFSNDDMHSLPRLGRNWNMLILPELSSEWVRRGMEQGLSYFIYAPAGHDGPSPPVIESINVNQRRGIIEINATDYESVVWIYKGNIIHEGNILKLNELTETGNYVRAKLYGYEDSVTGTQPFGIRKP